MTDISLPATPPEATAPPREPGRWVVALGVLIAILLVSGVVGALLVERAGDRAPSTAPLTIVDDEATGGTRPPPGPPASQDEIDAAVAELSRFVEAHRGLEFRQPVPVELLDDKAFTARLLEGFEDNLEDLLLTQRILIALRLIGPDVDLAAVLEQFIGESALGFYDPESKGLVVRSTALTPFARTVLVHELVHALDDQHFGVRRPEMDDVDDESRYAFTALIEGNAMRIEEAYRRSLPPDERGEAVSEEARIGAAIDLSGVPDIVPAVIGFPYFAGPEFVDALVTEGGEALVNEAFANPPTTTAQILEPRLWFAGVGAEPVPPPTADGEQLDQGAVGRWLLFLLLSEAINQADAFAASAGWAGDWYVAWGGAGSTCVRASFVARSAGQYARLADVLSEWAVWHGDARLERGTSTATITACG